MKCPYCEKEVECMICHWEYCKGSGEVPTSCEKCGGNVQQYSYSDGDISGRFYECYTCKYDNRVKKYSVKCPNCGGSGKCKDCSGDGCKMCEGTGCCMRCHGKGSLWGEVPEKEDVPSWGELPQGDAGDDLAREMMTDVPSPPLLDCQKQMLDEAKAYLKRNEKPKPERGKRDFRKEWNEDKYSSAGTDFTYELLDAIDRLEKENKDVWSTCQSQMHVIEKLEKENEALRARVKNLEIEIGELEAERDSLNRKLYSKKVNKDEKTKGIKAK